MSRPDVILVRPPAARALLVLAHGAGAGMRHRFMQAVVDALAAEAVATLRYQFPYMDAGAGRPDPPAVAEAAVCVAVGKARAMAPDLALFAGGKSFGGRMTSTAQAHAPLDGVCGLVFFGFPLHLPGRPTTARAAHLEQVTVPMLFLQGTRDTFATLDLMRPVCDRLGARATLHVVDGADHSFAVLKRSGRTTADVLRELAATAAGWMSRIADSG